MKKVVPDPGINVQIGNTSYHYLYANLEQVVEALGEVLDEDSPLFRAYVTVETPWGPVDVYQFEEDAADFWTMQSDVDEPEHRAIWEVVNRIAHANHVPVGEM